jgi:hypothetical protein
MAVNSLENYPNEIACDSLANSSGDMAFNSTVFDEVYALEKLNCKELASDCSNFDRGHVEPHTSDIVATLKDTIEFYEQKQDPEITRKIEAMLGSKSGSTKDGCSYILKDCFIERMGSVNPTLADRLKKLLSWVDLIGLKESSSNGHDQLYLRFNPKLLKSKNNQPQWQRACRLSKDIETQGLFIDPLVKCTIVGEKQDMSFDDIKGVIISADVDVNGLPPIPPGVNLGKIKANSVKLGLDYPDCTNENERELILDIEAKNPAGFWNRFVPDVPKGRHRPDSISIRTKMNADGKLNQQETWNQKPDIK